MSESRNVAVVLSGGGINGILLELGFLKRLRETDLWPRIGCICGTSAGALSGAMAALDRLDDLERFLLTLRAEETFRPQRLWRLPLVGLHDYALPDTVAARLGDPTELARELAERSAELVVCATDVTDSDEKRRAHPYELVYSSWQTPPEEMGRAIFASAAISAFVLPLRVGDRIATDGAWVRNFPLAHVYDRPAVERIVAFRYIPQYPRLGAEALAPLRRRLARFSRVPPVRALIADLEEAERRAARGEPAHVLDMIARLMSVAVLRNTSLEERSARERDESIRELAALREDVAALLGEYIDEPERRREAREAISARFASARFPFRRDRLIPRLTVRASVGEVSLHQGLRAHQPWTTEAKQALIARGYQLTDDELRGARRREDGRVDRRREVRAAS